MSHCNPLLAVFFLFSEYIVFLFETENNVSG